MRWTSDLWRQIVARGQFNCEAKLLINNKEYSQITAPSVKRTMMPTGLSVGNCCNSCLTVSIQTTDVIPNGAQVVLFIRVNSTKGTSEWKNIGVFNIASRSVTDTMVNLTCYDAMMRADLPITESNWIVANRGTCSIYEACQKICENILGVEEDDAESNFPDPIDYDNAIYGVRFPGEGKTYRDVLSDIAAVSGGNFIITTYDEVTENNGEYVIKTKNILKFVKITSSPDETFNVISNDYENITTSQGDNLVHSENPVPIANRIVDNTHNVYAVLGSLQKGDSKPITKISLTSDRGKTRVVNGGDPGYTYNVSNNGLLGSWNIAAIGNNLASFLWGAAGRYMMYSPFIATKCVMDPAIEIGDRIKIGSKVISVIYNYNCIYGKLFNADISSPLIEEDEYPYFTNGQNGMSVSSSVKTNTLILGQNSNPTQVSISGSGSDIIFSTVDNNVSLNALIARIEALENS